MGCGCFGELNWCRGSFKSGEPQTPGISTDNVRQFSYNSLRSATRDFHPSNRIGGGGYGVVHRGVLRDGTQVAIKSLSAESKQGSNEFLTEIRMISRIQHPNLVKLVGCCAEGSSRILVYEYLENNSLATSLLGSKSKHVFLDWPTRAVICVETATGLAFLHEEAEPHIVHRDIKASNILLDGNFHPKIGDFGLAKLFPDNVTHVSTRVSRNHAWKLREEGRLLDIVDPELTAYAEDEVIRFVKVALFCTQAVAHQRPSMKQVVEMLSKQVHLNEKALTEPGVYRASSSRRGSRGASSEETSSSQAEKGKHSMTALKIQSQYDDPDSMTQMSPR
ncbi:hypothetical protein CsatB_000480 [Cannabis sativa]